MPSVNADIGSLEELGRNIQNAMQSVEETKNGLKQKYVQLGAGWNDKKYNELGNIVRECDSALAGILKSLSDGKTVISGLVQALSEYENTNISGLSAEQTRSLSAIAGMAAAISGCVAGANPNDGGTSRQMTDEERLEAVMQSGQSWSSSLFPEEINAVRDYTGEEYYRNINGVLRGTQSSFDSGNENRANLIHSALSKAYIPCDCTVYRGAPLAALGIYRDLSDEELVGHTIIEDGFMSTSIEPHSAFSGEIRLEISVPEGSSGAYVGYTSQQGHTEAEVLFDAGQMMEITGARRDMFDNRIISVRIIN